MNFSQKMSLCLFYIMVKKVKKYQKLKSRGSCRYQKPAVMQRTSAHYGSAFELRSDFCLPQKSLDRLLGLVASTFYVNGDACIHTAHVYSPDNTTMMLCPHRSATLLKRILPLALHNLLLLRCHSPLQAPKQPRLYRHQCRPTRQPGGDTFQRK